MEGVPVKARRLVYGLFFAILLMIPWLIRDPYLINLLVMTCIWGSVVTNWNLTLGYGGMFHIAQLTLFAVGGYSAAMAMAHLGVSPLAGLSIGGAVSALAGLFIGIPSLRVKGIYLILLTFAFHYGVKELVVIFRDKTGGTMGLVVSGLDLGSEGYYYLALGFLLLSLGITWWIERSLMGKALMAVRDSEILAVSIGVNPFWIKLITFVTAAFLTGVCGAIYANYLSVIGPEIFSFTLVVNALGMMVIGGLGTLFGPVIGSFIITFAMEAFSFLEDWRPIVVGAAIILMLRYAPEGVLRYVEGAVWKRYKPKRT